MTIRATSATTELSPKAEEILQRAVELLAVGGYNGFSYADIAGLVNISKASIHHHFPSKLELVTVLLVRYREAARRGMQALSERVGDPYECLEAYGRLWAECIARSEPPICVCALLAAELPAVPEAVAAEVQGHFEELSGWLEAILRQGQATGRLAYAGTAEAEAKAFMATVHGAMLAARAFGDRAMFWHIVGQALERLRPG